MAGVLALVCVLGVHDAGVARAARATQTPPRATIIEVQQLFHELGYPLGHKAPGGLGVRTRGALSYFQRRYGLPITGYPDAKTVARMREVAMSLRPDAAAARPPRDLVERTLGDGVPTFAIAVGLAVLLGGLALVARSKPTQRSLSTDTAVADREEV